MKGLICPLCSGTLTKQDKTYRCDKGHCFDEAKQGYVNLLPSQKSGSLIGDNRDMAVSRRAFLEKGYFSALSEGLTDYIAAHAKGKITITDICCGEGYYGRKIAEKVSCEMYGFDISKEMVRLAAAKNKAGLFFVANISRIPLADETSDVAIHLFAPFHEKEFSRILRDDGYLISVIPGENHLYELKQELYDTPYKNDEKAPETSTLILKDRVKLTRKVRLETREDIDALFQMTPYYYHTKPEDKRKLESLDTLEVTTEFVMLIYCKK